MTNRPRWTCLDGRRFFASWSGGKDSCLALARAVRAGGTPASLFTLLTEAGERSHSHGLAREVLLAQADLLGLPIVFRSASWPDYETAFLDGVNEMRDAGAAAGVFGDIDLDVHRDWVERICETAGVVAHEPLWHGDRRRLLEEFVSSGFRAIIVAAKKELLGPELLGRTLDAQLIGELESLGVDASGELGEYHTLVTDGPLFSSPLEIMHKEAVLRDGYWFLDVGLAESLGGNA